MKELIERFYNSIRSGSPPPIPYREIILTARIMDEIFVQIYPGVDASRKTTTAIATRRNGTAFRYSPLISRRPSAMKYVLITPAHNEERFIAKTLESMVSANVVA